MKRVLAILLLLMVFAFPARAQDGFDFSDFSALPVLHEGRIKPIDSLARVELRKIHGAERAGGMNAAPWLARVLFDPQAAAQDRLFTVRDPEVRRQLGVGQSKDRTFSMNDLAPGLRATEHLIPGLLQSKAALTPSQEELVRIHEGAITLVQLMGAVDMLLPLDGPAAAGGAPDWLTLRKDEASLARKVKAIVAARGNNPEHYSDQERNLAMTAMQMDMLRRAGERNILFRIIPPQWAGKEWQSPWAVLLGGGGSPAGAEYLQSWKGMAASYRDGDAAGWKAATRKAREMVETHADRGRLWLEVFYRAIQPLSLAEAGYGAAFLFLVLSFWRGQAGFYRASLAAGAVAGALHISAIAIRVILLERPPVGTLYESLIFVSVTILLLAFIVELKRGDRLAWAAGLGGTLVLLYAAPVFAPAGDSLEVLVAVLNTNFWLATHVLCITIGYGVSIMAGIVAHFALLRHDWKLDGLLHKILVTALFFTAFGTMLGGIWADQSWGRFWGWDPKENGALLIVLWVAWILHGRYGGHLRGDYFRIAAASLNIIVALAWFGVNLLNVGLHSYGFTGEMAWGLAAFCGMEVLVLSVAAIRAGKRQGRAS